MRRREDEKMRRREEGKMREDERTEGEEEGRQLAVRKRLFSKEDTGILNH